MEAHQVCPSHFKYLYLLLLCPKPSFSFCFRFHHAAQVHFCVSLLLSGVSGV